MPSDARVTTLLTVAVCWGLIVGTALPAAAQSDPSDLGEVPWPDDRYRPLANLSELVRPLFATGENITVVGTHPIQSVQFERVNASATRVAIEEDGQNRTLVQGHEPWDGSEDTVLRVQPSQLITMVEVTPNPDPYSSAVFHAVGPPGSFNISGGSRMDKVGTVAEALGLPPNATDDAGAFDDPAPGAQPRLFHNHRGCVRTASDGCTGEVSFSLACDGCTRVGFTLLSEADGEFERAFGGDPQMQTGLGGWGSVFFDASDRIVAVEIGYGLDLDESAVLAPAEARNRSAAELEERGYDVFSVPVEGTLEHTLQVDAVRLREVVYLWQFGVEKGSASDENWTVAGDEAGAHLVQDAATGAVQSMELRGEPSEPIYPDNPLPAPGLGLVLAAGAAAALGWRRRGTT